MPGSPTEKKRINLIPYWFMFPAIALVILVSLYPIFYAVRWSFFNTDYLKMTNFIGFKNYLTILGTSIGWTAIKHSLTYVLCSLLLLMPFSLLLAMLLNRPIRFKTFFRTIIVLPWVVSQTIAALLWKWLLHPEYGPIYYLFHWLGGTNVDLLSFPVTAMASLVLVNVWISYPFAVVLILAALQTISSDIYEAATVDGARGWVTFRKITLPLIQPTLLITMIMLTLLFFNMVTLVYTFTGGGPFSGTTVLSLQAYKEAFEYWRMGLGATFSVIIFLFNIVFSLLYIKVLRKDVYE
jgi:multiple sugar transport system permease protein